MCWNTYLAADAPLPLVAWDDAAPGFHVDTADRSDLDIQLLDLVRRWLSKPHIYDLGAHTGCACGFFYCPDDDPKEAAHSPESRRRLGAYLAGAVRLAGPVELVVFWPGDQADRPARTGMLRTSEVTDDSFVERAENAGALWTIVAEDGESA